MITSLYNYNLKAKIARFIKYFQKKINLFLIINVRIYSCRGLHYCLVFLSSILYSLQ